MEVAEARSILERRLDAKAPTGIDIVSDLEHFALITYAVPPERLRPHIPEDRFRIDTFPVDGEERALVSVVPFLDAGFHFPRIAPFWTHTFCQTNFRAYVTCARTGERVVWFFGTTLGGWPVHVARRLWRIPWHFARYDLDCAYDAAARRYRRFRYRLRSTWCVGDIDLEDTGEPAPLLAGFRSIEEQVLVLSHPVTGYFFRTDGAVGTYGVSHAVIDPLTVARPRALGFSLLDRLGLVRPGEMARPHSALICPRTRFAVYMPPRIA